MEKRYRRALRNGCPCGHSLSRREGTEVVGRTRRPELQVTVPHRSGDGRSRGGGLRVRGLCRARHEDQTALGRPPSITGLVTGRQTTDDPLHTETFRARTPPRLWTGCTLVRAPVPVAGSLYPHPPSGRAPLSGSHVLEWGRDLSSKPKDKNFRGGGLFYTGDLLPDHQSRTALLANPLHPHVEVPTPTTASQSREEGLGRKSPREGQELTRSPGRTGERVSGGKTSGSSVSVLGALDGDTPLSRSTSPGSRSSGEPQVGSGVRGRDLSSSRDPSVTIRSRPSRPGAPVGGRCRRSRPLPRCTERTLPLLPSLRTPSLRGAGPGEPHRTSSSLCLLGCLRVFRRPPGEG